MKQVTLKSIYINSTNQAGEPLTDKNGNEYKRAVITTTSENKASLFISKEKEGVYLPIIGFWKSGDTVEVNIEKVGEYYNFEPVSDIESIKARISVLEAERGIAPKSPLKVDTTQHSEPEALPVINTEDPGVPFDEVLNESDIKVEDLPF